MAKFILMRIIKKGNQSEERKFTCNKCNTIFAATYLDIKPHITYECSIPTDTGINIDIIKANTKEKVVWVVHCPVCGKGILATEGEKIM